MAILSMNMVDALREIHSLTSTEPLRIWRRACIGDAGGWSGRTLTEDLDLSYRAVIKGWQLCFRPDVLVPAVPQTM